MIKVKVAANTREEAFIKLYSTVEYTAFRNEIGDRPIIVLEPVPDPSNFFTFEIYVESID